MVRSNFHEIVTFIHTKYEHTSSLVLFWYYLEHLSHVEMMEATNMTARVTRPSPTNMTRLVTRLFPTNTMPAETRGFPTNMTPQVTRDNPINMTRQVGRSGNNVVMKYFISGDKALPYEKDSNGW